jgi:DNA-binding transcriptional ArsR family regulator
MSALGPVVAGVLTGTVATVLTWHRNRPPRWSRPSTSAAEGHASIMAALQAQQLIGPRGTMRANPSDDDKRHVAATRKLLAHPLRHRLLAILNERTASPKELAREVGMPVPNVSYHVDRLLDAEAIELVYEEPRRGVSEHFYRAVAIASHSDEAWAALTAQERAQITHGNVQRMVADLLSAAEGDGFEHRRSHQSWVHFELDERGFNEVADVLESTLKRILTIRDRSRRRVERGAAEPYIDSEVVIGHFVRGRPKD